MDKYNTDECLAKFLRETFEKKFRNSVWHCVIGREFAMEITHQTGYCIYFNIGAKGILLFKTV